MAIHPKVAAGGITGAVLTLIVGVLAIAGIDIPDTVIAAVGTVATFGISWLKSGEVPVDE